MNFCMHNNAHSLSLTNIMCRGIENGIMLTFLDTMDQSIGRLQQVDRIAKQHI